MVEKCVILHTFYNAILFEDDKNIRGASNLLIMERDE